MDGPSSTNRSTSTTQTPAGVETDQQRVGQALNRNVTSTDSENRVPPASQQERFTRPLNEMKVRHPGVAKLYIGVCSLLSRIPFFRNKMIAKTQALANTHIARGELTTAKQLMSNLDRFEAVKLPGSYASLSEWLSAKRLSVASAFMAKGDVDHAAALKAQVKADLIPQERHREMARIDRAANGYKLLEEFPGKAVVSANEGRCPQRLLLCGLKEDRFEAVHQQSTDAYTETHSAGGLGISSYDLSDADETTLKAPANDADRILFCLSMDETRIRDEDIHALDTLTASLTANGTSLEEGLKKVRFVMTNADKVEKKSRGNSNSEEANKIQKQFTENRYTDWINQVNRILSKKGVVLDPGFFVMTPSEKGASMHWQSEKKLADLFPAQ